MKTIIAITIDDELLEEIDGLRGDVPRSPYLEKLIRKGMKNGI